MRGGAELQAAGRRAPPLFRGQAAEGDRSLADLAWWDVYRDPRLTALVQSALVNGYDARIAAARVVEARAIAAEVHGQRFPALGYAANADRGRSAVLGNPFPSSSASTSSGFDGYLGAAWELDLWGRVRRLDEAAQAQYLATEEGRRGVLLSLVSDVATAYYELLELDEERLAGTWTVSSRCAVGKSTLFTAPPPSPTPTSPTHPAQAASSARSASSDRSCRRCRCARPFGSDKAYIDRRSAPAGLAGVPRRRWGRVGFWMWVGPMMSVVPGGRRRAPHAAARRLTHAPKPWMAGTRPAMTEKQLARRPARH